MTEENATSSGQNERGRQRTTHETAKDNKNLQKDSQKKESRDEEKREAEERVRRIEKKRQGNQSLIPFKEASGPVRVIDALQDVNNKGSDARDTETKVIVSKKDLAAFKKILINYGDYDEKQIGKLTTPQLIVEAQRVIQENGIKAPQKTDYKYSKGENRRTEEALLEQRISKVESPREEILTVDRVSEYLSEDEYYFSESKDSGPGTMDTGDEDEGTEVLAAAPELPDFSVVVSRLKMIKRRELAGDVMTSNDEAMRDEYLGHLQEHIDRFTEAKNTREFRKVFEFVQEIDEQIYTAKNYEPPLPDGTAAIEIFNSFISEDQRSAFEDARKELDNEFQQIYDAMDDRTREILLGDLELKIGTELTSILQGWHDIDQVKRMVFGGKVFDENGVLVDHPGLVVKKQAKEEAMGIEGLKGIREWRATKNIYGAEERISIELLTRPPARWQEVPERVSRIYSLVERSDYSVEQLQSTIQKAVQMVESIQTNDRQGRKILKEMVDELNSFQAFHSFRITLEKSEMDPGKSLEVFSSRFDDETWMHFAKRFTSYSRVRENGERMEFKLNGEKTNLLDIAVKMYFEKIQKDRKLMNLVEALTHVGIDHELTDADFSKAVKFLERRPLDAREKQMMEALRRYFVAKMEPAAWGTDIGKMKEVITEWYSEKTLVGAFGRNKQTGEKNLDEKRSLIKANFVKFLRDNEFKIEGYEGSTDKIVDELFKEGYFDAVDLNAYNLVWSLAFSDFDIIRIYGKDWKTGRDSYEPQNIAFNQNTYMFNGRLTDHFMDFLLDEERGRTYESDEVNSIMRKHLLGRRKNMLPQNRTMVRFARHFMSPEQLAEVNHRARELMKKHKFVPDGSYQGMLDAVLADPASKERDPYFEGFEGWARSVVIAEMIDGGESDIADFTGKTFSEVAPKLRKFEMVDLYSDRAAAHKYMGRGSLQGYLRDPSNERFLNINDKDSEFYSGRNVRLWPWMNIAFRVHWEISHKNWKRLFDKDNLESGGGEALLEKMTQNGVVRKQQGNFLKQELLGLSPGILGTVPFRRTRQLAEFIGVGTWENVRSPGFWVGGVIDLFRRIFGYAFGGFTGK